MRIAWIIAGDEIGGVAQTIRGLTKAVLTQGIEPLFISLADGPFAEELRARGDEVRLLGDFSVPTLRTGIGNKLGAPPGILRATGRALPPLAAELVRSRAQAAHFLWPNLLPLVGRAARQAGIPAFWEMPNVLGNYPFGLNRRITQGYLSRYGVVALANSQATAESLGTKPVAPILLYLGADPARFGPAVPGAISRADLGIPDEAVVILMSAWLAPAKGQQVLLDAVAAVDSAAPLHLLFVGKGDSEYADVLRRSAAAHGIADRLHLTGPTAAPERYYGMADIAASATQMPESFGLSVVEAMLCGKPVLAHALGGPAETVVDGVTGWHVWSATVEAFRNGILRALADRPCWAEMGAAGRARALQYFSLPAQAARYAEIVRERLSGTPPQPLDGAGGAAPPLGQKNGGGDGGGGVTAPSSLTDQTASGFLWMLAQTVGSKIFSFGTQIVLARLLAPRDFGLIALAYAVVAFSAIIRNTGIQQILVQRHKRFRRWANPAFWFELAVSLATAFMLVVAAPIAGVIFHSHTLIGLILVIAAAAALSPWYVVPSAKLMMDMRFRALAAVNIGYNLLAMAVSLVLAWRGFGPYSFVIPLLVAGLVRSLWLWRLTLPPVGWRLQVRRWRYLVGDSFYMISTNFISSVMFQSGSLALGLFYAKSVVGQFFLALNLSTQVSQLLSQNLGSVLLPALAKLQEDRGRQVAALLRASRMLAFLAIPASLLLAAIARPVVLVAYGSKWLPAVPVLQWLAIATAFNVPSAPAYTALQSQGRFRAVFIFTLVQFLPFMAAVFAGARFGGAVGAAAAWLATQVLVAPFWIRAACTGGADWLDVARVYAGPFAASGLALAPALVLAWLWPAARSHYITYGAMAAVSMGILYPPFAWVFCRAELGQFVSRLGGLLSRLRRNAGRV